MSSTFYNFFCDLLCKFTKLCFSDNFIRISLGMWFVNKFFRKVLIFYFGMKLCEICGKCGCILNNLKDGQKRNSWLWIYVYIAALRLRRSEPKVSDSYSAKSLAIYTCTRRPLLLLLTLHGTHAPIFFICKTIQKN